MKKQAFRSAAFCSVLVAALLVACDLFHEEDNLIRLTAPATDHYILPHSSTVIDLNAIVGASFANMSIKVSESPKRGILTFYNNCLFTYTPSDYFSENVKSNPDRNSKDHFRLEFGSSEKIQGTHVINVHMLQSADSLPCSLIAVEDATQTTAGTSVAVKILFNDRLCGIKVDDVDVSISVNPKYGQASINGHSLIYTSETDFEGVDEIIYKISAQSNGQIYGSDVLLVSHGLVKLNVGR